MVNIRVNINTNVIADIETELERRFEHVGQFGENKSKEYCPVDKGIIRASMTHEADKQGTVIGTPVDYAIPVHEGHGSYQGKPFLKDAIYNHLTEIQNILGGS